MTASSPRRRPPRRASTSVTIKGADNSGVVTYHHVAATSKFSNAWDDPGAYTSRTDSDGNPVGVDYTQQHVADDTATAGVNEYKPGYGVVQDFAKAALSYATTQGIAPNYVETGVGKPNTAPDGQDSNANTGSVTVNGKADGNKTENGKDWTGTGEVPLGYYLVGTSMGTLASLDTTNKAVSIYDKNDEPTIAKDVLKKGSAAGVKAAYLDLQQDALYAEWQRLEDVVPQDPSDEGYNAARQAADEAKADYDAAEAATGSWVENTDADVLDYVQFRTVIDAQQGARDYRLHDIMEPGLELVTETPSNASNDRYTDYEGNYLPMVYLVRGAQVYDLDATQGEGVDAHTNWRLVTNEGKCTNCDFEVWFRDGDGDTDADKKVTFKDKGGNTIEVKDGDKIVFTYWCHVLGMDEDDVIWGEDRGGGVDQDSANISNNVGGVTGVEVKFDFDGDGRDDNYTLLTYGDKSFTTLEHASVTEYQIQIVKTDAYGTAYSDYSEENPLLNYTTSDEAYKLLGGAEFKIYKAARTTTADKPGYVTGGITYVPEPASHADTTFYQTSPALRFTVEYDTDYSYVGDLLNSTDVDDSTTTLVSTKEGALRLLGLEAGDYILVEEKAPEGYNKLAHPIVVTIKGDGDCDGVGNAFGESVDPDDPVQVEGNIAYRYLGNDGKEVVVDDMLYKASTADGTYFAHASYYDMYNEDYYVGYGGSHQLDEYESKVDYETGGLHIVNQTGQELPSTGGIGTTIFYVAGTVLVVGAAVMLVAKRRMGAEA